MAQRYAVTQQLAEAVKAAGFRGDVGYQTLLYSNTVEVRRVLMFLVERLPKDVDKGGATVEPEDATTRKIHEIAGNIRSQLRAPWVPDFCRRAGSYKSGNAATGKNFVPKRLCVPYVTQREVTEEIKEYWRRHSPSIFQQTDKTNLLPSVLDTNDRFTSSVNNSASFDSLKAIESNQSKSNTTKTSVSQPPQSQQRALTELLKSTSVSEQPDEIEELNRRITELQGAIENQIQLHHNAGQGITELDDELTTINTALEEIEREKLTEDRIEMLLEDPENSIQRLEERIESLKQKKSRLQEQWETAQAPVLEQLQEAQRIYDEKDKRVLLEIEKVRETYDTLIDEFNAKIHLHANLLKELQQVDQSNNRTAFTSRILDIINNIKKQDRDIGAVLKDTRKLQKEINTISGQLDRQFSATDDLIFQCAKQDENAKRAYKLLATLHADLGGVVDLVTETGVVIREVRDIEDQVDMERSKNVAGNLEQILTDIQMMRQQQQQQQPNWLLTINFNSVNTFYLLLSSYSKMFILNFYIAIVCITRL